MFNFYSNIMNCWYFALITLFLVWKKRYWGKSAHSIMSKVAISYVNVWFETILSSKTIEKCQTHLFPFKVNYLLARFLTVLSQKHFFFCFWIGLILGMCVNVFASLKLHDKKKQIIIITIMRKKINKTTIKWEKKYDICYGLTI